jgi:hypothetical protein
VVRSRSCALADRFATTDFEVLKVGAEGWGVIWLMMSPTGGCLPSMCLLSSG